MDDPLRLGLLLLRRADALAARLDHALAELHGVGAADLRVLVALETGGDTDLAGLADELRVAPSQLSRQLGPLERIGLVSRQRDLANPRAGRVALTTIGRDRLEEMTTTARLAAGSALSGLDEAGQQSLAETLGRIRE